MKQNAYVQNEERIKMLKELAERPLEQLMKLAIELGITAEDLLRILAGVQGIDPELGQLIEQLWQIKKDMAQIPVTKPDLVPEEKNEPLQTKPEPREPEEESEHVEQEIEPEGIKQCSFFAHENDDFLTQSVTGSLAHEMNQKDILTSVIDDSQYDKALNNVREQIDQIYADFINSKNDVFEVSIVGEHLNTGTLEGYECPSHRTYEFESYRLVSGEDENVKAYGLRYSKGVAEDIGNDTLPRWVIDKIVTVLRWNGGGVWEK